MQPPLTFIVNVFKFFDRKDLEIISTSGKYVNRIVRKHFPSKPYRLLNDITLVIRRDEKELVVALFSKKYADDETSGIQNSENESSGSLDVNDQSSASEDADDQSSGALCFKHYKNEALEPQMNEWMDLERMRPFLSQFVRFRHAELFFNKCPFTQEDMTILHSISHVWSGRLLWLYVRWPGRKCCLKADINFRNNATNSFHNILSNDAIFSTRCLELYEVAQFVDLHNYSRVYTVDVLLLTSYDYDPLDIATLLALIEHKPQFPESKTVFVVDISLFETGEAEVTDAICKSFSSVLTPCPFQLLIIDDDSNGESEEIRMENGTTREVLQLKNVKKDSVFVTRICEICNHVEFHDKFVLIERSRF